MSRRLTRRRFVQGSLLAAAGLGGNLGRSSARPVYDPRRADLPGAREPKVVLIQYGGCVRRRETVADASTTLSHFLFHKLMPEGTTFTKMRNAEHTGHSQGTLYLFTGAYDDYPTGLFKDPFHAARPTLGEYLRKGLGLPEHQVLVVHNEQEDSEFIWASDHPDYGPRFRPGLLSLYRLKRLLLERDVDATMRQVEAGHVKEAELLELERGLAVHLEKNHWPTEAGYLQDSDEVASWNQRYLAHYEPPGARTREDLAPQGHWTSLYGLYDRLLPQGDPGWTVMALRALSELRPRFLSIIYRDVDYVHWGLPYLYSRGIQRMDQGLWEIARYLEADPYYAGTTTLLVVPEAGRNTSPYRRLPFQHHDPDDEGSHEVFLYARGPGIQAGKTVDVEVDTIDVVPTIGKLLGVPTPETDGRVLGDLLG